MVAHQHQSICVSSQTSDMGFTRNPSRRPSFGLNRIASRARDRSPPIELKPISASVDPGYESSGDGDKDSGDGTATLGKRVMIVVDSSSEAKSALLWALSHAVQSQDTFVLLSVTKPSRHGDQSERERDPKSYKLLCAMKNICQAKKPEVRVELSRVEGKEQGSTIVEEARRQGISLLVLGQKKQSIIRRLLMILFGNWIKNGGMAEYCVENAKCMTLAVRRKSRRAGGYLISSKRHKDFWLLA